MYCFVKHVYFQLYILLIGHQINLDVGSPFQIPNYYSSRNRADAMRTVILETLLPFSTLCSKLADHGNLPCEKDYFHIGGEKE